MLSNLTRMLAKDGEGASKLLECTCAGAPDLDTAIIVAKSVIRSPLLKCEMCIRDSYGYDSAAEYTQALSLMKKQLAEAGFAKENMDSALQKKTQFENDNDMDKLLAPNECPYTLDELNEMISKVEGSLDEIRASLVQYGRQMDLSLIHI